MSQPPGASTDAFRLAMIVSAGLLLTGAVNTVGIRTPSPRDREAAPDATQAR